MKEIVIMIRTIRISSLCPPEFPPLAAAYSRAGSLPKWFSTQHQAGADVCLHTQERCAGGRKADMNGEERWKTDLV